MSLAHGSFQTPFASSLFEMPIKRELPMGVSSSLDANGEEGSEFHVTPFASSPSASLQPLRTGLAFGQDERPIMQEQRMGVSTPERVEGLDTNGTR